MGKSTYRLDQLLRGRVEKFPGYTVEGDILPRFIFNGQEQFIEFPVNNVCVPCHVLSNVGKKGRDKETHDRMGCFRGMTQ